MRRWLVLAVGVVGVLALLVQPAATDAGRFDSVDDLAAAAGCERLGPLVSDPSVATATSCRLARGQSLRLYWFDHPEDRERYERLGRETGITHLGDELWLISANRTSTLRRVQDRVGGGLSRPWLRGPG